MGSGQLGQEEGTWALASLPEGGTPGLGDNLHTNFLLCRIYIEWPGSGEEEFEGGSSSLLLLGSVPTLGPRGSGVWAEVLRDGQDFSQAEMKVKNFPEGSNHRDTIMKCKGTGLVSGVPCFFHTWLFCFMAANPVACSYPGILSYTVRRSCKASLVVNTYFAFSPLLLLHGGWERGEMLLLF